MRDIRGYDLTEFRKKETSRIAQKEASDYAGFVSETTKLTDIFAGRLLLDDVPPGESKESIKLRYANLIYERFRQENVREIIHKVTIDNKDKDIKVNGVTHRINIRYMVFNDHIELQVLMKAEADLLYLARDQYVEDRVSKTVSVDVGRKTGNCLVHFNDFHFYHGDWINGKRQGKGYEQFEDGTYYRGEYKNDLFHGLGTMGYSDGSHYDGQWENGMRHGSGTMRFVDDKVYQGTWSEGFRFGKNKLSNVEPVSGMIILRYFSFTLIMH
jgi:hypothetical protein